MFSCVLNQDSKGFGGGQCVFISYLLGDIKVSNTCGETHAGKNIREGFEFAIVVSHLSSCDLMQRDFEFVCLHQFLVVGRKCLMFSPLDFSLERLKHKRLRNKLRRSIWPKLRSLGTESSCGVGFSVENSQMPKGGGDRQRFEGAPP